MVKTVLGGVNKIERGLLNYSPDRISPIKPSLYGVYVSSLLSYPGREFLCWFKIISLRRDWYLKENLNRSNRFGQFKLLLTTGDGQLSFVTLDQKRGQFSLGSVGLPCDTLILVFIMTCLIVILLEGKHGVRIFPVIYLFLPRTYPRQNLLNARQI